MNSASSFTEKVSRQFQSRVGNGDKVLTPSESLDQYISILLSRFEALANYVVSCLSKHGICVIDKFLGESTGHEILNEVMQIQSAGVMKQGQLVQGTSSSSNRYIRGDIITWLDGSETQSENIHFLISCMDAVMIKAASQLEAHRINERTKVRNIGTVCVGTHLAKIASQC